jgi:phosphopantothenoylcysteine decarboxylase/phosphopantothenate--cysteine ligase
MTSSDLQVNSISESLLGKSIDVVITGSIGSVEAVRFLRSLRRLGADVHPWLSKGAMLFTTETAVSWAAANPVTSNFSGTASHIALHDACVVSPASANFIAKISNGITDTPESALVASYLGQGKPVLVMPNMHDSLIQAPAVSENLQKISKWTHILKPRQEEGKQKFPEPKELADQVSHILNRPIKTKVLVCMGTTKGFIDDVRYISNYSSGALGTAISEELYRSGFSTEVVCGPCEIKPKSFSKMIHVETNEQMLEACKNSLEGNSALVMLASVLDFVPEQQLAGKLSSSEELKVEL